MPPLRRAVLALALLLAPAALAARSGPAVSLAPAPGRGPAAAEALPLDAPGLDAHAAPAPTPTPTPAARAAPAHAAAKVVAIEAATEPAVPHLPSAAAAVPQATAEAQDPAVVPRSLQTPAQRTATYLQNLVGQGRDLGIRLPSPPYFAFNADKPTLVQNACDQVVATSDAPLSKPAAAWIKKMQVANGDGWNKTFGPSILFFSKCIVTDASPPHVRCDYEIEKLAETSGFKILQNPPKGVKLVGCNIKQDGSVRTSPTCFARPDTKFSLTSADAEINLKSVVLTVDAVDEAGGGGSLHTHYLHCQSATNDFLVDPFGFTPINQVLVTDPRKALLLPNIGEFGDSGIYNHNKTPPAVRDAYEAAKARAARLKALLKPAG